MSPRSQGQVTLTVDHFSHDQSWITSKQLARHFAVDARHVDVLIKLGYLARVRFGPRCYRFWTADALAGVRAFVTGSPPPRPKASASRHHIDWEAAK